MRYDQILQLVAVARTGNFRKASRELGLSQPALTRSIQNLEEIFGVPLFDRLQTGVVPTLYGEKLIEYAKKAITNTNNIKRQIDLLSSASTGTLVVGTTGYFVDAFLAEAIARMIKESPRLKVKVRRDTLRSAKKLLENREVDLFLGWVPESHRFDDLAFQSFINEEIILFCRKGHPLLGRKKMDPKVFFTFPFAAPIMPDDIEKVVGSLRNTFVDADEPLLGVEFDSYSEVRKVVELSDCVGGLPESRILPYIKKGIFRKLPPVFPSMKGGAGVVYQESITPLPAAELLIEKLKGIVQEFYEGRGAEFKIETPLSS